MRSQTHCLFSDWYNVVYETSKNSGNLVLVSGEDGHKFHLDILILAANSKFFKTLLASTFNLCYDEDLVILLPDCSSNDIQAFIQYLYCIESSNSSEIPPYLTQLLDVRNNTANTINRRTEKVTEIELTVVKNEEISLIADISFGELQNLLIQDSKDITFSVPSQNNSVIDDNFVNISVQGVLTRYLSCNECADILKVPENQSLTAIKRHVKTHETKVKGTANKKSSNSKKKGNSNPEKIDISIDELNISKAQNLTENEQENESTEVISKIVIEKLIAEDSERLTILPCHDISKSKLGSLVWTKFHKIEFDGKIVPFVACASCMKIYTFSNERGTSQLLRHICDDNSNNHRRQFKETLKLLMKNKSRRIKLVELDEKFNDEIKDMLDVYSRLKVDGYTAHFICCKYCDKLFVQSVDLPIIPATRNSVMEHECYLAKATCFQGIDAFNLNPENERDMQLIYLHAPGRIKIREKDYTEATLYRVTLDGVLSNYRQCVRCRRFFSNIREENLKVHRCHKTSPVTSVNNSTPFECNLCHENCKSNYYLEIHMRQVHNVGQARVMCTFCGKDFATAGLARKHEQQLHNPDRKKYGCVFPGCNMIFVERNKLKAHSIVHNTDGKKPYICDICGKGFNWLSSFQDHKDMHANIRKFSCNQCEKSFTKRNTYNNHRRLHTGEKPFMCPAQNCGMTFVQRTACKTHAKRKHNIEIIVYTRNPAVERTSASLAQTTKIIERHTGDNNYIISKGAKMKDPPSANLTTESKNDFGRKRTADAAVLSNNDDIMVNKRERTADISAESNDDNVMIEESTHRELLTKDQLLLKSLGGVFGGLSEGGIAKNLSEPKLEISSELLAKLQNDGQVQIQLSQGQVVHIIPLSSSEFASEKDASVALSSLVDNSSSQN